VSSLDLGAAPRAGADPRPAVPADPRQERIVMLLENNPYPQDVRVRSEAESLARAGHHVTVIAPRDGAQPRRETVNGVRVSRFALADGSAGGRTGFLREYAVAALALHRGAVRELRRGATVLHLHNPPDIFFGAGALYRLAGRKVIFDHHDLFPQTIDVKFGPGVISRVARVCERLTFAVADHVLATNASYAEVALGSGKDPARVTIVRNGPPEEWTRRPRRRRAGVLAPIRLAYLGAMSAQDGVDGLAPILAALRSGGDPLEAELLMIGDGDARPGLQAELGRRGLAERVTFTGRVAPARVPELLSGVDVCLDPAPATDVNRRSTMTKIAEYLALGKPVVAYDLLESRRTAGEAALFVAPGDADAFAAAIRRLAREPELRRRLADAAGERAGALTWAHSERALLAAYAAL
jgi:glycosyltransferase involved in cell wall biosynthesis